MPNFKLVVCYDGSRYKGWQKQGNTENTIQARLENALNGILGEPIEISGSGRTDAGAHAKMQVASFRAATKMPPEEILKRLRGVLPEDIGALSLCIAEPRFHARLSCVGKTYVYRVWNSGCPNVFERKYLYTVTDPLDLALMQEAAGHFLGSHDFSAFCSLKRMKRSAVRRIDGLRVERLGDEVRFTVSGDGFLYNMVRIIVGTLLETGKGNLSPDAIPGILASLDRQNAGPTAPAKGLCLNEVRY